MSTNLQLRHSLVVILLLIFAASAFADSAFSKERTVTPLGDGIYEIRHPDAADGFPNSNTTVIIGDNAVLIVDSTLLPSLAQQDIQQIKQWTNKPVTYLVNTHWHFDHTMGNATYAAAFPAIQIVAQTETRKTIAAYNPGAAERYPSRRERLRKILDSGKDPDGNPLSPEDRKDYQKAIDGNLVVVAEFQKTHQLVPNVGFDRELNLDLGNRPVQIR